MKYSLRIIAPILLYVLVVNTTPGLAQPKTNRVRTRVARRARPSDASTVFGAAQTDAAGFGGATQSVAGDFNGDGITDIAVVNPCNSSYCGSGDASVAVLIGNGDGSFQTPVSYATGSYAPMSIAAGDLNGDGAIDLVVASQCASSAGCGAGQVSVLLGNGDGTFQSPVPYTTGTGGSYFVVTGDFNGDGNLDVAVANQTSGNSLVAILLGNGDGTLRAPASYTTGAPSAAFLAVGDFNGDGVPDLVVANGGADSVSILIGNGDGAFQAAAIYASGGAFAYSVAVADFNGDGASDLAVVNGCATYTNLACSQGGSVGVLLGNGDGTFQPPVAYGSGGNKANFVSIADFDGDGNLDLAVSNLGPSSGSGADGVVSLLPGNGDGTFQPAATFDSGASAAASVLQGDFNLDGQPDLAVVNQCPASGDCDNSVLGIMLNTASGFSLHASSTSLTSSANPAASSQAVLLTAGVTAGFDAGAPGGSVTFYDGVTALASVAVSDGQASYTASFDAPGPHFIQAVYSGDTNYASSASAVLPEMVGTPVRLTSSLNPAALNQAVTLTATVAGTGDTPTGSVTFTDGATSLGTFTLANGVAAVTISSLAAGTHSITASYSGDPTYPAGAARLTQAVSQPSTTVLTSSANPANTNQPVTYAVTVTGLDGSAATGAVAFLEGASVWGTAPLVNGQASLLNSFDKANTYMVSAVYLGGPNYQASTSAVINQVVNLIQNVKTTTTLSSSGTPSYISQPVTFIATVSPTSGTVPDGELVTFYDGANTLGSAPTANGAATLVTSSLPMGVNSITATYPGDGSYLTSTSRVYTQVVKLGPTTTTLSSSLGTSTFGQQITFTVTVAPQAGTGTPTGKVTIKNGSIVIGSANLSNGTGSLTTSSLPAGSLSLSASYAGDADFAGSSVTFPQTVAVATTTTALTSTPNPSSLNQTVTFTATVTGQYGGTIGGTVTFTQNGNSLGDATPVRGKATVTTAFSTTGTFPVIATYSGDASNAGSASAAINQVVGNTSTTTTLTSSGTPAYVGQTVTFTATVTSSSGTVPDGEAVTFYDGSANIGASSTINGIATLATSTLATGTHSVKATYAGDSTFKTSTSKVLQEVVNLNTSNTTLASSANPSAYGQNVTLTATVAPTSGSTQPTGKVIFKNGTTAIASVSLVNGTAAYTTSGLTAGALSLTASYSGDANFAASSATITQTVNPATTTTTLTSNPNPSSLNQTVTFTATVAAQYLGAVTGSVTFMDGAKTLGSASLSKGTATLTYSFATAGTDSITAVYAGDANNQTSTSPAVSQVVTNSPTTTTVTSSGSPAYAGQSVTFTATVTSTAGQIPDGELVTFYDSSTAIGTGNTASGVATMTTSSLSNGAHNITAAYAGDSSFQSSTSKILKETINADPTTTVLTTSANPAPFGQPIMFTATVTSAQSTPAGTVTFKNGTTSLGTASLDPQGVATLTTLSLGAGVYSITASYNGNTISAKSTSAPLNQAVIQAVTTTQLVSSVNPAAVGESVTFTAIVRSATAFATGSVTFTAGSTTLGTVSLTSGSAKLTLSTLPAGTTAVTATYPGSANIAGSAASIIQIVE